MIYRYITLVLLLMLPAAVSAETSSVFISNTINSNSNKNQTIVETIGDAQVFLETYVNGELAETSVMGEDTLDASKLEARAEVQTEIDRAIRELVRAIIQIITNLDHSL